MKKFIIYVIGIIIINLLSIPVYASNILVSDTGDILTIGVSLGAVTLPDGKEIRNARLIGTIDGVPALYLPKQQKIALCTIGKIKKGDWIREYACNNYGNLLDVKIRNEYSSFEITKIVRNTAQKDIYYAISSGHIASEDTKANKYCGTIHIFQKFGSEFTHVGSVKVFDEWYIENIEALDVNTYLNQKSGDKNENLNLVCWLSRSDSNFRGGTHIATVKQNELFLDFRKSGINRFCCRFPNWGAHNEDAEWFVPIPRGFIAPDQEGYFNYWFCADVGKYIHHSYSDNRQEHKYELYSMKLKRINDEKYGICIDLEREQRRSDNLEYKAWDTKLGLNYLAYYEYCYKHPGPAVSIEKDSHLAITTAKYNHDSDRRKIRAVPIKLLNKKDLKRRLDFEFVKSPYRSDGNSEEKLKDRLYKEGATVIQLIYGWPFYTLPYIEDDRTEFSNEKMHAHAASTSWNIGVFASAQIGAGISLGPIEGSAGIKSTFSYDFKKTKLESESQTVELGQNMPRFNQKGYKVGCVFYFKQKIVAQRGLQATKEIQVVNDKRKYQYNYFLVELENARPTVLVDNFILDNPDKLWGGGSYKDNPTKYSPFSAGLAPKPMALLGESCIDPKTRDYKKGSEEIIRKELEEIYRNQVKMKLDQILKLRKIPNTGITNIGDGEYSYALNRSKFYEKFEKMFTETSENALAGSISFVAQQKSPGSYCKFEVGVRGGTEWSSSDSKSNAYSLTVHNSEGRDVPSYEVRLYALNIDIGLLKGYLSTQNREVKKPSYIPQWCWDRNQNFLLYFGYVPYPSYGIKHGHR